MTEESLKQQTVTLLEQMVSIPADQMTTIVEQNRKAGSEAVAAGLETYVGLSDDLGCIRFFWRRNRKRDRRRLRSKL